MTRAGAEYQELVALVAKALDSDARVKTGQWVKGPDGQREVDVEVRGTVDGKAHFILIECKDWKKSVDIQEIDKLDSKRRDLGADAAMIYSNSGFTKKALRKAGRLGIGAVSAIAGGHRLVRPVIERELVAKHLSVDSWTMTLYFAAKSDHNLPDKWDARTLRFDGLPVVNWLTQVSMDLLRQHEGESKIVETVAFKTETPFTLENRPVILRGLRVDVICSRKWLSQTVREDVSLGVYNHITRRLTVPNNQLWTMGWIDQEAWKTMDIDGEPEEWTAPLEPGCFRLNCTQLNPIAGFKNEDTPQIDNLIGERRTDLL